MPCGTFLLSQPSWKYLTNAQTGKLCQEVLQNVLESTPIKHSVNTQSTDTTLLETSTETSLPPPLVFFSRELRPPAPRTRSVKVCGGPGPSQQIISVEFSSLVSSAPALVLPPREMATLYSLEHHWTNCNCYLSEIVSTIITYTPRPCGVTRRKGF